MKARTKFEKWVAASNEKLTAIGSKAVEWAVRNVLEHIAFRTSRQKCTCGDCGEKFDYKGKGKFVRCPHCGSKLEVKHLPISPLWKRWIACKCRGYS